MRSLSGPKFPDKPADPIIVHPDVRRMLLTQKCFAEGARAMCYDVAMRADEMLNAKTVEAQKKFDAELGLFTPIAKGFLTELGLEAAKDGMQIWGGAGFTRDPGMEQIYRDARISTVYEGTTGVQALDLLGRKILLNKGVFLRRFTGDILKYSMEAGVKGPNASKLRWMALQTARHAVEWNYLAARLMLNASSNKEVVGASSVDFLMYSGYSSMAYQWLRMANVALDKLRDAKVSGSDAAFYRGKLETAQFYFERILPRTRSLKKTILASPKALMQVDSDRF
jgi:Acetyl-CoA dehydrogenase C-terminal like/Acyl-CoA dehydrogenase, C-terminal domain